MTKIKSQTASVQGGKIRLKARPLMSPNEIVAIEKLIRKRKVSRVLEWGGGGSTLYWPKLFPEIDWVTVESDPRFVRAIMARRPPSVTVMALKMPAYCNLKPEDVGLFDLIIVDGIAKARVPCLDAARKLLTPDGVALLHNTTSGRYDAANALYHNVYDLCGPDAQGRRGVRMFWNPRGDV